MLFERVEGLAQIGGDIFATLGPFEQDAEIVDFLGEAVAKFDVFGEAALPLERLLRLFLVVPEIRRGDLLF